MNGDIMTGVECLQELIRILQDVGTDHEMCCRNIVLRQEIHESCSWLFYSIIASLVIIPDKFRDCYAQVEDRRQTS